MKFSLQQSDSLAFVKWKKDTGNVNDSLKRLFTDFCCAKGTCIVNFSKQVSSTLPVVLFSCELLLVKLYYPVMGHIAHNISQQSQLFCLILLFLLQHAVEIAAISGFLCAQGGGKRACEQV